MAFHFGENGMTEEAEVSADVLKWRGFFKESLYKVCNEVHCIIGIQEDAIIFVEDLIIHILTILCGVNSPHGDPVKTAKDVELRVQRSIPSPINLWAIKEANSAVRNKRPRERQNFPIQKLQQALRDKWGLRLDEQVARYIAAVLEYIAADILKLTGNYVKNIQHSEISCADLKVAMRADRLLWDLFFPDFEDDPLPERPRIQPTMSYEQTVRDIVQSEQHYCRDLDMIVHVFLRPMSKILLSTGSKEIETIFGNILDVQEASVKFLGLLEDALEMSREGCPATIGSCFIDMAEGNEFDVYGTYAEAVLNADCWDTIQALVQRKSIAKNFEELESTYKLNYRLIVKYLLYNLLLGPIVHCYDNYFNSIDLLLSYPQSEDSGLVDEDRLDLENTKSLVFKLRSQLDACWLPVMKRKPPNRFTLRIGSSGSSCINHGKLDELQRIISGWDIRGLSASEYIMEGSLGKISVPASKGTILSTTDTLRSKTGTAKKAAERYVFLFESHLVLSKITPYARHRNGGGAPTDYRPKEWFVMRKVEVLDRDESDDANMRFAFEVRPHDDYPPIILFAKSAEEKHDWMSAIINLQTRSMLARMVEGLADEEKKNHPLMLPSPEQYRFAEKDSDGNIIFEDYTSSSGIPVIKAATVPKLLERLTYHAYADQKFMKTFMTTYRTFCTPKQFLELLIERYDVPNPPALFEGSAREPFINDTAQVDSMLRVGYKRFRDEYVQPVQLRVLNVLRHWIDHHWHDFETDEELLERLEVFIKRKNHSNNSAKWVNSILKIIERKVFQKFCNEEIAKIPVFTSEPPPIEWHLPIRSIEDCDLMTLHPIEIARQVTLIEFDLYRAVKPIELVGAAWTKKDKEKNSPALMKLINHSSLFTYWLEKNIVEAENFEERVAVLNRIYEIMCVFYELNNFTGLIEIYGALESASINRLKISLERVDRGLQREMDKVRLLFSDPHFKPYLNRLRAINPPCVPFFGKYLTYILLYELGNPAIVKMKLPVSATDSSDEQIDQLINFTHRRKISEIISEIQMYQNTPYCLAIEPTVRLFFENLNPLAGSSKEEFENYLWNKSLLIEPKELEKPLPDKPSSRSYSLKSPGIKPQKYGTSRKQNVGFQPTPPFAPLTPLVDYKRDRHQSSNPLPGGMQDLSSPTHFNSRESDMGIVEIKPGNQPKYIGDCNTGRGVGGPVNGHRITASGDSPASNVFSSLPRNGSGTAVASGPPIPPRPPKFPDPQTPLQTPSLHSAMPALSPPLPPKPPGKSGKSGPTGATATAAASQSNCFDFSFDFATPTSNFETSVNGTAAGSNSPGFSQAQLSRTHSGAVDDLLPNLSPRKAFTPPPPAIPPRKSVERSVSPDGPLLSPHRAPTPHQNVPGRRDRPTSAELSFGQELVSPSAATGYEANRPPPLPPRRDQRQSSCSPPPRPPPRGSYGRIEVTTAPPPLPPKTYRQNRH